jgi:hypothetical protein
MSTSSQGFPLSASSWVDPASPARTRRRRVPPRAAQGIDILRSAIEYLANEVIRDSVPPALQYGRMQAVELLMALNREVYLACPVKRSFAERCRRFLRGA